MTDDRFDDFIKDAAQQYREPPETPRDAIWQRIEAARRNQPAAAKPQVVDIQSRRRLPRWTVGVVAIAAVLLVGIAIGRWSLPEFNRAAPDSTVVAAAPTTEARAETMMRFAAIEHLGRVETLLTDYETGHITDEFRSTARSLLSRTRLLLDSKSLADPAMRKLFEDLEVLLVQVAQLTPNGQSEERALIDDNLAGQAIRPRLRNAIPSGPTA
jgi:hypothetical protein